MSEDNEKQGSVGASDCAHLLGKGDRFRMRNWKTVWEVLDVAERGWVVGQYLPGERQHHGHMHLVEWHQWPLIQKA